MVRAGVNALIKLDKKSIFDYLIDLETLPEYNSSVRKAIWKDKIELQKGKKCLLDIGFSFISLNGEYEIIDFKKDHFFIASFKSSQLSFIDKYEIIETNDGNMVNIEDEMTLHGLLSFSEPILRATLPKEMQSNMDRLVKILNQKIK
jgi:hypothetical protein